MATVLDTLITRLGFETDTTGLDKAESGLDDLKTKTIAIAGAIGTVLGGGFLINRIADVSEETLLFADSIGSAVEEVSALDFAVDKAGGSVDGLRGSLFSMAERLGEAARGSGEAITLIEDYDLALTKADGTFKNTTEALLELNKVFVTLSTQEQIDLALKFGIDEGTIRLLQMAPEAVEELLIQAKSLGVLSRQEAVRFKELNDSITNMGQGLLRLGIDSINFVIRPLTDLFNLMAEGTIFVREHITFFKILTGLLATVAGGWSAIEIAAGAAQLKMFAMPLLIIALIALFALLTEDVIAYFNGQDSLLGDAVKKWPELETVINIVADALKWLKEITVETFDYWKNNLPGIIDEMKEWAGPIWDAVEALTELLNLKDQFRPFAGSFAVQTQEAITGQKLGVFERFGAMLKERLLGVPAGLSLSSVYSGGPSAGAGSTNTVNIDKVEVNAQGGDSQEIARNVSTSIGAELQNMVQNVDSTIKR